MQNLDVKGWRESQQKGAMDATGLEECFSREKQAARTLWRVLRECEAILGMDRLSWADRQSMILGTLRQDAADTRFGAARNAFGDLGVNFMSATPMPSRTESSKGPHGMDKLMLDELGRAGAVDLKMSAEELYARGATAVIRNRMSELSQLIGPDPFSDAQPGAAARAQPRA